MTVIKSLLIPKFVYILSLLPVPMGIIQELNRLLFKFLWKGTDKVISLSTINEYENGGLKMIDLESMIKSLQLAWLKRIFGKNDGAWKSYLCVSLQCFGGLFLFYCNYYIRIILFLLCSIPNYFSGGPNFEMVLILEKSGNLYCGRTKRYVLKTGPSFMRSILKTVLFMLMTFYSIQMLQIRLRLFQAKSAKPVF